MLLSVALEMQGRHRDSLDALVMYEDPRALAPLDAETSVLLRVQMGIAYNYNGDHPKAIALLNSTARDAEAANSNLQLGALYPRWRASTAASASTPSRAATRSARSNTVRLPATGAAMAESYFAIAMADVSECDYEPRSKTFEQSLNSSATAPPTSCSAASTATWPRALVLRRRTKASGS